MLDYDYDYRPNQLVGLVICIVFLLIAACCLLWPVTYLGG